MDASQVAELCNVYDLGSPLTQPAAVSGGQLHRVWRLQTSRGTYAVKQLNPAIVRKPGIQDLYELTEQIAAALAAQDIPAVAAMTVDGNPVQQIQEDTFLVYAWIEGEVLSPEPVEPGRARQMGNILGKIHTTQLQFPALSPLVWHPFRRDDWDLLAFHAADRGISWAYQVRTLIPKLLEWSRWHEDAGRTLSQYCVISHCDLDQKNVMWQDTHTPRIIDWEAAGPINPTMELVGMALYWSGQTTGAPDESTFAAVMDGYVEAGGIVHNTGIQAMHGFMGTWLNWLLFNMRRSLGESVGSEEERQIGVNETLTTLIILRSLASNKKKWARWVDKWR